MSESLLVSVREASQALGLGRDTTYRLVREGRLRSVCVSRRVLVPRAELAAFVARESAGEEVSDTVETGPGRNQAPAVTGSRA